MGTYSDRHKARAWVICPSKAMGQHRYEAYVETPDGEAKAICAYEEDALRFIRNWFEQRGLQPPEEDEIDFYGRIKEGN